jgi:hypothetical protein
MPTVSAWDCTACTWGNLDKVTLVCVMCSVARPRQEQATKPPGVGCSPAAGHLSAVDPPPWECKKCQFSENAHSISTCFSCSTSREYEKRALGQAVVAKVASVFSPAFATVPALPKKLSAPTYPRHPDGIILDIFGTNRRDCGRSCKEHGCCSEILTEDVVVRLRHEQILVPNKLGRKGSMREETAITVNWVTDGVDRCRVGFLPKLYVATGSVYDGVLCQIVYVGSILSTDKAEAKTIQTSVDLLSRL